MAIIFKTSRPNALLASIKKAIDEGHIVTWSYDTEGDFTHVTPDGQWENRAWLRPKSVDGELQMSILGNTNTVMSKVVYAVYHGRFIECVLEHFDTNITNALATALKSYGDNFKTE